MTIVNNVLVTGPFGAGKTQFIKTISDVPVVSTERRVTRAVEGEQKSETTVAMDYGRFSLNGRTLHLRGTPGQARFDFMWEILSNEAHAALLLLDSARPEGFPEALGVLDSLEHLQRIPRIIVANKQDLPDALKLDEVRRRIDLPPGTLLMPCTGTRKSSVRQVLRQVVEQLEASER